MESVAFPDAEAAVVAYLAGALTARGDSTPISGSVPNPRPARFVRAIRTGGTQRNLAHEDAWVTLECWDADAEDSFALARVVAALMRAMDVSGAHVPQGGIVSGPVNSPDPVSGSARYVLTAIVRQRAQVLEVAP